MVVDCCGSVERDVSDDSETVDVVIVVALLLTIVESAARFSREEDALASLLSSAAACSAEYGLLLLDGECRVPE